MNANQQPTNNTSRGPSPLPRVLDVCDFFDEASKGDEFINQQPHNRSLHNPITLSGLNPMDLGRAPQWQEAEEDRDPRMINGTYMPVPLQGAQDLSPAMVQGYSPAQEQQLMSQLRAQNGLNMPPPPSTYSQMNSPDTAFIRNQLWRMDQMYVENELRIQHIDSELCQARGMLSKLFDSKADGKKSDKASGMPSKKKKQKLEE